MVEKTYPVRQPLIHFHALLRRRKRRDKQEPAARKVEQDRNNRRLEGRSPLGVKAVGEEACPEDPSGSEGTVDADTGAGYCFRS